MGRKTLYLIVDVILIYEAYNEGYKFR